MIIFQPKFSFVNSLWQSPQNLLLGILKFHIEFFVNMGPYGSEKIFNATSPTIMILFDQNFCECFLWQSSQKLLL